MNNGPKKLRAIPQQFTARARYGFTEEEKTLKQTRSRKGCIGTCRTERASDPHNSARVPWMNAWIQISSERRRKACFESVARVRGRNIRIWSTVESLKLLRTNWPHWQYNIPYLAVPETALHIIHGFNILSPRVMKGWKYKVKGGDERTWVLISTALTVRPLWRSIYDVAYMD